MLSLRHPRSRLLGATLALAAAALAASAPGTDVAPAGSDDLVQTARQSELAGHPSGPTDRLGAVPAGLG